MRTKNLILLIVLLSPLAANYLISPAKAAFYQSTYVSAMPRQLTQMGSRLVAHDATVLSRVNYYAVLYVDSAYALYLNTYYYLGNTPIYIQQAVSVYDWIGGNSSCYAVSNVISSVFYIAYQTSFNTFAIKRVQFLYNSSYYFSAFLISSAYTFQCSNPIFDTGLAVTYTTDGIVRVGMITQTTILRASIYKIVNHALTATNNIDLPDWNFWSVQLARIGTTVYAWTYSTFSSISVGSLYYADNSTKLFDSAAMPCVSSAISLTNNTISIVYGTDYTSYSVTTAKCIMYSQTLGYRESDIPLTIVWSMSAFAMPNGFMGFFYTDVNGLNVAYHCQNVSSPSKWSWTSTMLGHLNPQLPFMQEQVYADEDATLITYPAHPTVWVYATFNNLPYWSLISIDFSNVNNIVFTTSYSSATATQFWTYISIRTTWSSYATTTVSSTITQSLIQSSSFIMNLVILTMFMLVPAGLFGFFLGLIGYGFGAMVGVFTAYAFGQMPIWLLLVIVLLMTMMLVLFRSVGHDNG